MGILDDRETVVFRATWDFAANSDAHIHDKSAFLLLGEELKDLTLAVDLRFRQRRQPDRPVKECFVEQLDRLEFIDVDFDTFCQDLSMQSNLVVLGQEVLLHEDVGQLMFALCEDKLFEQFTKTFVVDEVGTNSELGKFAFWIRGDSVDDCFQASDADSVVADI